MKYIAHQKSPTKNKNEIHCASEITSRGRRGWPQMKYMAHQKSEIKSHPPKIKMKTLKSRAARLAPNEIHGASEITSRGRRSWPQMKYIAHQKSEITSRIRNQMSLNAQQPTLGSSVNLLRQKSPTKNKNENSQFSGGEAGPK
jgi:hypothetical protein